RVDRHTPVGGRPGDLDPAVGQAGGGRRDAPGGGVPYGRGGQGEVEGRPGGEPDRPSAPLFQDPVPALGEGVGEPGDEVQGGGSQDLVVPLARGGQDTDGAGRGAERHRVLRGLLDGAGTLVTQEGYGAGGTWSRPPRTAGG